MASNVTKSAASQHGVPVMRSQLGRVRGLGSARSGVHHWWMERVTSLALIPLTLWFIYAVLRLHGQPYLVMRFWAAKPVNTVLLLCTIIATFHHMQLGLQVVIEDYIHAEAPKFSLLLLTKAASFVLGLAAAVAVLKLAF